MGCLSFDLGDRASVGLESRACVSAVLSKDWESDWGLEMATRSASEATGFDVGCVPLGMEEEVCHCTQYRA